VTDLLRYEDAAVGYGPETVVQGVNLSVAAGEVVGLAGPNGAGKTTLLRAVTGGARLLRGSLTVDGRERAAYDARSLAQVVAVLPQAPPQTFAFTARRFVEMGRHAHLRGLADLGPADVEAVERAMALTDTARLADTPVDRLSGGDLQRLTLAQTLAQAPRLLLLDEPTSHLDLDHTLQVLDLVRSLSEGGLAVLAVFHDLGLAARYADRIAVVAEGGICACGTPEEVLTPELLTRVFRVRAVVGTDAVTGAVSVTPVLRDEALVPQGDDPRRVLVVSGAATGAGLLRRLVLSGWLVSCAALNRGDTDQAVADVLGLDRVELPPFGAVDETAEARVASLAQSADVVLIAPTPFGTANLGNLRAAVRAGKPLVIVRTAEERDFTSGEATRLLAEAGECGAIGVADEDAAVAALERVVAR
jgi:iron complex transport system ATP-binding protein